MVANDQPVSALNAPVRFVYIPKPTFPPISLDLINALAERFPDSAPASADKAPEVYGSQRVINFLVAEYQRQSKSKVEKQSHYVCVSTAGVNPTSG